MKYLVAIDKSNNAKAAFHTALSMIRNKAEDELYLISVIEEMRAYVGVHGIPASVVLDAEESAKKEYSKILRGYAAIAKAEGLKHIHLLVGICNHIGEMICQTVESKKIDFLIMGRRGLGRVKRLFVGSSSKYCVEHANCNVLIVKGEWAPAEEHADVKDVIKAGDYYLQSHLYGIDIPWLEEEERERRKKDQQEHEEHPVEHVRDSL